MTAAPPIAGHGLVGRRQDLEEVRRALAESRLVTVVGPGGVGKTALASAVVAADEGQEWFVDLTCLESVDLAEATAGTVGFSSFQDFVGYLEGREGLVVLDNCEHLIDGAADLASRLTAKAGDARVLATSREPLHVAGEHVVRLAPLATDGPDDPGVELFREMAQRRGTQLVVDASVVDLCRQLDGLPLALELAAAQLTAMTPAEITRHIRSRIDLLDRARRDAPDRHRSLPAAVAWSYNLLDESTRSVFEAVSVFEFPFDLTDAAIAVAADVDATRGLLQGLVDRSLLTFEPRDGRSRFRMLETIRAYGIVRLEASGRHSVVRERVVDHLVEIADDHARRSMAMDDESVLGEVVEMVRPMRKALDWCLLHDTEPGRAWRIVAGWWVMEDLGYQAEVADVIERVVARWPEQTPEAGAAWGIMASLHRVIGRHTRAETAASRVVSWDSGLGAADGYRVLGHVARANGDHAEAERLLALGAACARSQGFEGAALEIEMHAALATARAGDVTEGLRRLDVLEHQSRPYPIAHSWVKLVGVWVRMNEDPPGAGAVAADILASTASTENRWAIATAHLQVAMAAMLTDDDQNAVTHVADSLAQFDSIRNRTDIVLALRGAALVFVRQGDGEWARSTINTAVRIHPDRRLGAFEEAMFERLGPLPHPDPLGPTTDVTAVVDRLRGEIPSNPEVGLPRSEFRRAGESWSLTYQGSTVLMNPVKGLDDIAFLLSRPGRDVAAIDLMGAGLVAGNAGPVADETARRAYSERIHDLQSELEEATVHHDPYRAETARTELEALTDEMAAAFGLSGRQRQFGDPAEKARQAVTWRVRSAISRVRDVHPALGDHLDRAIKTGRSCSYRPEEALDWQL